MNVRPTVLLVAMLPVLVYVPGVVTDLVTVLAIGHASDLVQAHVPM
jgi:hypothetical protein